MFVWLWMTSLIKVPMTEQRSEPGHAHPVSSTSDMRYVLVALVLISAFLVGEVVAAVLGHSLVLFADAGHMSTDVAALALSAWAIRLARRPAHGPWTFGLQRAEILSAAANGVALVAISLLIGFDAIERLIHPHRVHGGLVLLSRELAYWSIWLPRGCCRRRIVAVSICAVLMSTS